MAAMRIELPCGKLDLIQSTTRDKAVTRLFYQLSNSLAYLADIAAPQGKFSIIKFI